MNKILNNHKVQMDVINDSLKKQAAFDEMIELQIDDAIEKKNAEREAFIQFNEDTKDEFNKLTYGDRKENDNGC